MRGNDRLKLVSAKYVVIMCAKTAEHFHSTLNTGEA